MTELTDFINEATKYILERNEVESPISEDTLYSIILNIYNKGYGDAVREIRGNSKWNCDSMFVL